MTTTDVSLVVSQLDPHQKQISEHEADSILARWEFGRVLRAHIPEGKQQLPKGLRSQITEKYNLEASEITRRMQLAEKFASRQKVVAASTSCGNSWRRMIREQLPKTPRKEKPEQSWSERTEADLARWRLLAHTPTRRQKLADLLRDALLGVEADMATDADVAEAAS